MIATIVIGISLIILIIMLILFCEAEIFGSIAPCVLVGIALIFALVMSLSNGESITKKDTYKCLVEKEQIEYMLENKNGFYYTEYVVNLAKEHNSMVQEGNNYWCRFNIEDRSAYLIDIDSFIRDGD